MSKPFSGCRAMTEPLLSVRGLVSGFSLRQGDLRAVDGVSFDICRGETIGIAGESGCGKSMLALSIMNLLPRPNGRIFGGQVLFRGEDLLEKSPAEMKSIQGKDIAMIFQEPMTSLNPVLTVGWQIAENIRTHCDVSRHEAKALAIEMLRRVNISMPEQRYREYPHQLSGGMRQRVMIAMALACEPLLLICDEPTTALDVTVQAQILGLIQTLKSSNDMSVILISHDLGVISQVADRVIIMYAGEIVESGLCTDIFDRPLHPYTQALLHSVPRIDRAEKHPLFTIPGSVPDLLSPISGCRFAPRCPNASAGCFEQTVSLLDTGAGRWVRCLKYKPGAQI